MAEHISVFSTTDVSSVKPQIQQAIDSLVGQMQDQGTLPNWTTLQVSQEELPTSLPQVPVVLVYGVLLSSIEE